MRLCAGRFGNLLQRIQIIKGWIDEYGDANEKIMDVVWSGDREIDPATGKLRRADGPPELALESTPDILAGVVASESRPVIVGFAAEVGSTDGAVFEGAPEHEAPMIATTWSTLTTLLPASTPAFGSHWLSAGTMAMVSPPSSPPLPLM